MDSPSIDQHVQSEGQGQNPGLLQDTHEQALSSPSQQIHQLDASTVRAEAVRAEADRPDRRSLPSDQARIQLLEEDHAHESSSNITGPAETSANDPQNITASQLACQTPSLASSVPTELRCSDLPAAGTPMSPSPSFVSSDSTLHPPPTLRISESLGLEGCAGIIGGSVGILGVFGFLAFLWFGAGSAPEAANATWVWRQLAMRNWMPRAVTLTSIILRFIIGVQATICTSMIAALLLERLSVPRSQVAHASLMRGINDGPWKLVMLVLSFKAKISHILWHLEAWLILLVALLSLALQFTSTILLSDMHSFVMIGDPNTTTVNSLLAYPGEQEFALLTGDLMATKPVFPVFGEVPTTQDSSPDSLGFSDTGLKQRGLLPMSSREIRTSIREYEGMGMTMSSRVACMRPVFTNVSITSEPLLMRDAYNARLQGILDYGQGLKEARPGTEASCSQPGKCEKVAFDCSIPAAENATNWAAGGCAIDCVGGHMSISSQPTWDPAGVPWSENSSIWLVYSTNMEREDWMSLPPSLPLPSRQPLDDSEWAMYEVAPGHFIKLSACFSAFNFAHRDIRMTAAGATTERSKPFSMVLDSNYKMSDVETYLGLNPSRQTFADRGILELQIMPDGSTSRNTTYTPPPPFDVVLDLPADEVSPSVLAVDSLELLTKFQFGNGNNKNLTFVLCTRCYINAITLHMEYASLFSSIILGENSGVNRAADALSAFINLSGFNIYDQFLDGTMDVTEQVRLVTTLEVTVPGAWKPSTSECAGLIAVTSLLASYLALVSCITFLYVRHTRYSRYGNVWHVVSQLSASKELGEILELGNNADDKTVRKGPQEKELSKEDVMVKVVKVKGSEKIEVKKCRS